MLSQVFWAHGQRAARSDVFMCTKSTETSAQFQKGDEAAAVNVQLILLHGMLPYFVE